MVHVCILALTNHTAGLHPVLVYLHQVVGQVAELWLHTLKKKKKRQDKDDSREKDKRSGGQNNREEWGKAERGEERACPFSDSFFVV